MSDPPVIDYDALRAKNIAAREEMFKLLGLDKDVEAVEALKTDKTRSARSTRDFGTRPKSSRAAALGPKSYTEVPDHRIYEGKRRGRPPKETEEDFILESESSSDDVSSSEDEDSSNTSRKRKSELLSQSLSARRFRPPSSQTLMLREAARSVPSPSYDGASTSSVPSHADREFLRSKFRTSLVNRYSDLSLRDEFGMSADEIQRAREGGPDMGPAAIRGDLGSIPAYDAMAAAISAHDRSSAAAHHGMAAAITSHDRNSAARRAVAAALNPLHRSSAAAHHGVAADMHEYESDDDLLEPEQFLAIRQNSHDDEFSILTKWKDKTEDFNAWVPISSFFMRGYEHKLIPFLRTQGYAIDRSHGAPTVRERASAQPHSDKPSYADFIRASAESQKVPPLYIRGFSLDNSSGQPELVSNGQDVEIFDRPKYRRPFYVTGFSIDTSSDSPQLRRNGTRVQMYSTPSSKRSPLQIRVEHPPGRRLTLREEVEARTKALEAYHKLESDSEEETTHKTKGKAKKTKADEKEYEVEELLDHRILDKHGNRVDKFLVKWKGYDLFNNTWEPRSELMRNCEDLVLKYEQEHADEIEPLRDY